MCTLLWAFREIGPLSVPPPADRERAARIVRDHLLAAGSSIFCGNTQALQALEDGAQKIVARLVKNGPRGVQPGDPTTDDGARWFLRRALENEHMSYYRDERGPLVPGTGPRPRTRIERLWETNREGEEVQREFPDPNPRVDDQIDAARARCFVEALRSRFFDVMVPEIAREPGPLCGDALVRTVRDCRRLVAGELSIRQLAAERLPAALEEYRQGRSRAKKEPTAASRRVVIDTELLRMRKRLLDGIAARREKGELSRLEAAVLEELVGTELRLNRPPTEPAETPKGERERSEGRGDCRFGTPSAGEGTLVGPEPTLRRPEPGDGR